MGAVADVRVHDQPFAHGTIGEVQAFDGVSLVRGTGQEFRGA